MREFPKEPGLIRRKYENCFIFIINIFAGESRLNSSIFQLHVLERDPRLHLM